MYLLWTWLWCAALQKCLRSRWPHPWLWQEPLWEQFWLSFSLLSSPSSLSLPAKLHHPPTWTKCKTVFVYVLRLFYSTELEIISRQYLIDKPDISVFTSRIPVLWSLIQIHIQLMCAHVYIYTLISHNIKSTFLILCRYPSFQNRCNLLRQGLQKASESVLYYLAPRC